MHVFLHSVKGQLPLSLAAVAEYLKLLGQPFTVTEQVSAPSVTTDAPARFALHAFACDDIRSEGFKHIGQVRQAAPTEASLGFVIFSDEQPSKLVDAYVEELGILGRYGQNFEPASFVDKLRDLMTNAALLTKAEQCKRQITRAILGTDEPQKILDDIKELAALGRTKKFYLVYLQASVLDKMGAYQKAVALAEQSIELNRHFLPAWSLLAKCQHLGGHKLAAKEALGKALGVANEHVEFLIRLGDLHFEEGEFEKSDSFYRRAIKVDSSNKEARAGIITSQLAMGKAPEAADLGFFPTAFDLARISNLKGVQLTQSGRFEGAEVLYQNALTYVADTEYEGRLLFNLGLLRERQRDLHGAQQYYQRAKNLAASFPKLEARLELVTKKLGGGN